MELKKTIGKMGSLAKSGAQKAGAALKEEAKETFTKENASHLYHETKEAAGTVIHEGSRAANKLATYGARVDRNASQSWLLNGNNQHEYTESFLFGRGYEKTEHRKVKPTKQTIVININERSHKRRRHRSKHHYGPY